MRIKPLRLLNDKSIYEAKNNHFRLINYQKYIQQQNDEMSLNKLTNSVTQT